MILTRGCMTGTVGRTFALQQESLGFFAYQSSLGTVQKHDVGGLNLMEKWRGHRPISRIISRNKGQVKFLSTTLNVEH